MRGTKVPGLLKPNSAKKGKTSSSQKAASAISPVKMATPVTTSRVPIVSSTVRMCLRMRPMNFMNGLTARAAIRNGAPMPAA